MGTVRPRIAVENALASEHQRTGHRQRVAGCPLCRPRTNAWQVYSQLRQENAQLRSRVRSLEAQLRAALAGRP
jgi:hypothetical protein